jgi:ASCH domain
MKSLSVRQPWAALLLCGAKRYETRNRSTPHRGLIAIHASSTFTPAAKGLCRKSPFADALAAALDPDAMPLGALIDEAEHKPGWLALSVAPFGLLRPGLCHRHGPPCPFSRRALRPQESKRDQRHRQPATG